MQYPHKIVRSSGKARAFPGGRLAHPEDQIEEENEQKNKEKWEQAIEE